MANVIQESVGNIIPKVSGGFAIPRISTYDAILWGLIIITVFLILLLIYKFKVYNIKLIEFRDLGNNAFVSKILSAKAIQEHGFPKLKIWGKKGKDNLINYPTGENLIPLETAMGFMKSLLIMHKDGIGDYRPAKMITKPELVNYKNPKYYTENPKKQFKLKTFLDELFPILHVDNLKMRTWYHLKTQEALNIYKESFGEFFKKNANLFMLMFVIVAVGIGAYLFLV